MLDDNDVFWEMISTMTKPIPGMILVLETGVFVAKLDEYGETRTKYPEATMDSLQDAARVLGQWLELPKEEHDASSKSKSGRDDSGCGRD